MSKNLGHFSDLLASYYRKFVKQFAFIAQPLTNLLQKDVKWTWSKNNQQAAFRELKKRLTSTPVLLFPDFDLGFTIQTDSSGYAIGGVLLQDQGNGSQPIIAYKSRKIIIIVTQGRVVNGGRRHAEPPGGNDHPQLSQRLD